MEEKVGSFIMDENGNLTPNQNDEAMAEREKALKPEVKKNGKK